MQSPYNRNKKKTKKMKSQDESKTLTNVKVGNCETENKFFLVRK